jgi:uridylate kinase
MKETHILSVGGSIIIPSTGFNTKFLKKFRSLILQHVKKGTRFVLVIGGGKTAREYQEGGKGAQKLTSEELDWLGIYATELNARFVHMLFKGYVYKDIISDPRIEIKTNKPIIIASGWKPGFSTDFDAVLLAKNFGAKKVFNLSNIEYVYNCDPNKYKNAVKIKEISWTDFRRNIVGNVWKPGSNAPFDPIASKEAENLGLEVGIIKGTHLKEVHKALLNKKFKGTIIR